MKESLISILLLCTVLLFAGCAGPPKGRPLDVLVSEHCQTRALAYEKNSELQLALYNWKIVSKLSPEESRFAKRLADLQADSMRLAEKHFKMGATYFNRNNIKAARKKFLIALRHNPYHKGALDYVKNTLFGKGYVVYVVKAGDTIKDIARAVYKDSGKDFLISHITGLDAGERPVQGTTIMLPVLESELTRQLMDVEKELAKARGLFKLEKYEKVISFAHRILEYDPKNKEAVDLANASYFQIGKQFCLKGEYPRSLETFNQITPGYDGVQEAIAEAHGQMSKQVEMHYTIGVNHFVNEELIKAIEEWEKALALNPEHQKAKSDIENARSLLEKLKQIK